MVAGAAPFFQTRKRNHLAAGFRFRGRSTSSARFLRVVPPPSPFTRRWLAAFCRFRSQIHSLASPRGDGFLRRRSSRVVDGGDPPMIHYASRGRLVCVIREFGNGRGVVAKFARMRCTSRERLVMERFQRSAKN